MYSFYIRFLVLWILKGCGYSLWHQRRSSTLLTEHWSKDSFGGKRPFNNSLKINCLPCAVLTPKLFPQVVPRGDAQSASLPKNWIMNNFILLEEQLIKKSQQKRRTSPSNFKVRFFVLTKTSLAYFENRHGVCEHFVLSFFKQYFLFRWGWIMKIHME